MMARVARIVVPGRAHHVTQRGNRRMETFFCGEDYQDSGLPAHEDNVADADKPESEAQVKR